MKKSTSIATSNKNVCTSTIVTSISKIKAEANSAIAEGRDFKFPPIKDLLGAPPTIPFNSDIEHVLEAAKKITTYYERASYIEREFAKICKKKRA